MKSGEPDCSTMRNALHNGADASLGQFSQSGPEEQVKGEALPQAASLNLAEMQRLWDSDATESSNAEEMRLLNDKWSKKNGFLGRALGVCAETIKGDLLHQILHGPSDGILSSTREEVYARLLQCVTKQQMEISRAKRTQKRLQMLLAKHVIKHCDQQLKCFVKHQLQRMKVLHKPAGFSSSSSLRCTEGWPENTAATLESSSSADVQNGVCVAPGEIRGFALSAGGLLSRVEKDLDSDATCSSSDEDYDEQTVRTAVEASYTSEWKWLADRARIGSRWTWLQAQISELEYKIQQLTDLHRQIRATKGMVILEEFPFPKDILKKQIQLTDQEALLNATGNSQAAIERQDSLPEHDFEMSPSSPTLLLRNIEKQSAQLSEIISSLIAPLNLSPASSLSSKTCRHRQLVNGISFRRQKQSPAAGVCVCLSCVRRTVRAVLLSGSTEVCQQELRVDELKASSFRDTSCPYRTQLPCTVPASALSSSDYSTESKMLDYVQELDSSFHPVLSFPSDIPLHIYFETLLRKDDIKGEPVDASYPGAEFKISPENDYKRWNNSCLSNSKSQSVSGTSEQLSEGRKKRHLSETAVGERNSRFETFPFQHAEPESPSSFAAVTNISAMSRPTHSTSSQVNEKGIAAVAEMVSLSRSLQKKRGQNALSASVETSYSKNADGRHSQDSKDHPGSSCASLHCAAEPVPDLTAEAHSSVCSGIAQLRRESQEAKSGLWELRVFPLTDEEVEALLCQDQITNQTEMSSAAFPSDSPCAPCTPTGLPDNGLPPRKQAAEEAEDCENVCLGVNNTRKQR
ncbi:UNVERIFIED_CONTAM: hypothetical protein H355_005161 [Colinus virginianus]|nr:hypothetical protein H355_005161 [Colinus virginianus]